jgi:archaemetzincin
VHAITLSPVGSVPAEMTGELSRFLYHALGTEIAVDPQSIDPAFAYRQERGQFNSRALLTRLEERAAELGTLVLGLTEEDLFSPVFTFVFGEARLRGPAAVFSSYRLRPERYGLPADPDLVAARARREALHEIGHLFGLVHCKVPDCAMRFSGSAEEIDLKQDRWCSACRDLAQFDRATPP